MKVNIIQEKISSFFKNIRDQATTILISFSIGVASSIIGAFIYSSLEPNDLIEVKYKGVDVGEYSPQSVFAKLFNIARKEMKSGNFNEAISLSEANLIQLNDEFDGEVSESESILNCLIGECYIKKGDKEKALPYIEESHRIFPNDYNRQILIDTYIGLYNESKDKKYLEKVQEVNGYGSSSLINPDSYFNKSNLEQDIDLFTDENDFSDIELCVEDLAVNFLCTIYNYDIDDEHYIIYSTNVKSLGNNRVDCNNIDIAFYLSSDTCFSNNGNALVQVNGTDIPYKINWVNKKNDFYISENTYSNSYFIKAKCFINSCKLQSGTNYCFRRSNGNWSNWSSFYTRTYRNKTYSNLPKLLVEENILCEKHPIADTRKEISIISERNNSDYLKRFLDSEAGRVTAVDATLKFVIDSWLEEVINKLDKTKNISKADNKKEYPIVLGIGAKIQYDSINTNDTYINLVNEFINSIKEFPKSDNRKVHLVTLGIQDYNHNEYSDLNYAENDINLINKIFMNLYNDKLNVTKIDGNISKEKFVSKIKEITNKLNINDHIVFYFSGHSTYKNGNRQIVLNKPNDKHNNHLVSIKEINDLLGLPKTNKSIILDACKNPEISWKNYNGGIFNFDNNKIPSVVSSNISGELFETNELQQGVLTYFLSQELEKIDKQNDLENCDTYPEINFIDIMKRVDKSIQEYSNKIHKPL